ncbi:MAG: NAD(P)/FAD-dependent oxidoreductase [Oscillospiraceae bacterium]|nr:NAD(P)/FAD-dependent oxidoreductase [Oscillospiraceae bacterium]
MNFYHEHYDAILVGGALSGLAAALTLSQKGKKVLVLEQHNLPGGLATSFVRGGVEIEATLHEMMSIGPEDRPLKIREFFDEMGVDIHWKPVPELYHASLPGLEVTLHDGFESYAKGIAQAVPGTYEKILRLMQLCNTVYNSVNVLSVHPMSKVQMLRKHEEFVKTAGYSAQEVIDTFHLPKQAVDLLSPYWIYVGNPLSSLPFTVWAVLMADYVGYGSQVPEKLSHEMSLKMAERAEQMGAQIEYCQRVDKILVKNGRVSGVRTDRGDEIHADYVICSAYPNQCYTSMIEPPSEVPAGAIKMVNGRKLSLSGFTVFLLLDQSAEALNIRDYNVFRGDTMDTDAIYENYKTTGPYRYLTAICLNLANPTCTPEGTCILSITALPLPDGWKTVTMDTYDKVKHDTARSMIEEMSRYYGVDLLCHVLELVIETPMTVAHYTGAWNGCVYGYAHCQDDNIVARLQMDHEENFIQGLEFSGAHCISGNGMSPQVTNGRKAAKSVLEAMAKEAGK